MKLKTGVFTVHINTHTYVHITVGCYTDIFKSVMPLWQESCSKLEKPSREKGIFRDEWHSLSEGRRSVLL